MKYSFSLWAWIVACACLSAPHFTLAQKATQVDRDWDMRSLDFGIGYGDRSNVGFGKQDRGVVVSMTALSFARGFNSTNGFGIGTSIYEGMWSGRNDSKKGMSSHGLPASFFPIYIYFPTFYKINRYKLTENIWLDKKSPFIYAFAGGSLWGKPNDYFHIGIGSFWDVGNSEEGLPLVVGIQVGAFASSSYVADNGKDIDNRLGVYMTLKLGYGRIQ